MRQPFNPEVPGFEHFPAVRELESFYTGEPVFVPRATAERSGPAEASLAEVVEIKPYPPRPKGHSLTDRDNPSTGYVIALTDVRNRISPTYFIGDATNAGIIPARFALALIDDAGLRQEWKEGAQWPKDDDWEKYSKTVLADSLRYLRLDAAYQRPRRRCAVGHSTVHAQPQA